MKKGLIIGKFYPPHAGHKYLIETGLSQVDELTILLCQKKEYKISGSLRANWLKQIHPEAIVKVIKCDGMDEDDSQLWANKTKEWLGFIPDVVFTSENYGKAYTKLLGSEHVLVDLNRNKFPVSGTKVRENPFKEWEYLDPEVKAHYVKRVCVLGAESSGTTTLSQDLAKHYKTSWVPEFGRTYFEAIMNNYHDKWYSNEFEYIAKMQNLMEDQIAKRANKVLICDTNSLITTIWHKGFMGYESENLQKISKNRKYDLYILTDIDIPYSQDGTRRLRKIRENMHEDFKKLLKDSNSKFLIVSGSRKKRLKDSILEIDKLIS